MARFCHRCGTARRPTSSVNRRHAAWVALGLAIPLILVVGVLLYRQRPAPPPDMASAEPTLSGRAPDISQLSPQERFDRLYDRAMAAMAQQDTATALAFADHALGAFAQLERPDARSRDRADALGTLLRPESRTPQ